MQKNKPYVIVTGATGAIGKEIVRGLVRAGESVVLACRNEEKATSLIAALRKEFPEADLCFQPLDLADERSVLDAANTLRDLRIRGLVNNAGVMNRRYHLLPNGVERTVAVNYLFTAVFTELLLPAMEKGSRIVFTTSLTRFLWKKDEGRFRGRSLASETDLLSKNFVPHISEKEFSQLGTYGLSKRLITDYAGWLSVRLVPKGINVNCADPGVVNTGMIRMERWYDRLADLLFRPFIRSPRGGAVPALRALESNDTGWIFTRYRKRRK